MQKNKTLKEKKLGWFKWSSPWKTEARPGRCKYPHLPSEDRRQGERRKRVEPGIYELK